MVRPGIAVYGIDPTCGPSMNRKLRPALKWVAPIIAIHDVPAGATVGYGQTWTSQRATRIGLVPVGYADGYLRCFSNRAMMLLTSDGRPVPVVGRVSMDMTTIDLGDVPGASVGDDVIVLDSDPLSPCSAYALAKLADTIPYEIFCRIGHRVTRVAVDPEDPQESAGKNASWPIADSTSQDGFAS
jgi:alanine racemase